MNRRIDKCNKDSLLYPLKYILEELRYLNTFGSKWKHTDESPYADRPHLTDQELRTQVQLALKIGRGTYFYKKNDEPSHKMK